MIRRHITKLVILVLLIAIGISIEVVGLLDVEQTLKLSREYAQQWWLIIILIVAQALLFTFALAGSVFLWIAAPLYSPPMATFILAAGGTLGGLGAYGFSRFLTEDWKRKIESSHSYKLLHSQDNFLTMFAMRVFPAFPHALVNYSSGILSAKLSHFVIAAILGISIKSYIYARAIYGASSSLSLDLLLDPSIFGPLIGLSLISVIGVFVNYRRSKNQPL